MDIIELIKKSPDGRMRACWLGNDGWLFGCRGHLIATDLDLYNAERSLPGFEGIERLAEMLDFLLVTHAHDDHLNVKTVLKLQQYGQCRFIMPRNCSRCVLENGIGEERVIYAEPGPVPLDSRNNPLRRPAGCGMVSGLPDWLSVRAIHALHGYLGGSVYGGANFGDCGYVIDMGGKRIVQPGDSVLLAEHLSLRDVDALLVSPTQHNMGTDQIISLVESVKPVCVFSQHFGTYAETGENSFWTHGYQKEFAEAMPEFIRCTYTIPVYMQPYLL